MSLSCATVLTPDPSLALAMMALSNALAFAVVISAKPKLLHSAAVKVTVLSAAAKMMRLAMDANALSLASVSTSVVKCVFTVSLSSVMPLPEGKFVSPSCW